MSLAAPAFGGLLRRWRQHRGLTQMALALDAEVSTRHLSFLESGKAEPSRAMVLRLAERLDLPLRERNAWLVAAGFAPMYRERPLTDPGFAPAQRALQRLLDAHEPAPALAVDRHWQLVAANRMVALLTEGVSPDLLQPPLNVLRLSLSPEGLAPRIRHFAAWRHHVLERLQRQWAASADPVLHGLLQELRGLPLPAGTAAESDVPPAAFDDVAVPLELDGPHGRLRFLTTITVFGAPHDVTLSELAVETLLPADPATADALKRLQRAASERTG